MDAAAGGVAQTCVEIQPFAAGDGPHIVDRDLVVAQAFRVVEEAVQQQPDSGPTPRRVDHCLQPRVGIGDGIAARLSPEGILVELHHLDRIPCAGPLDELLDARIRAHGVLRHAHDRVLCLCVDGHRLGKRRLGDGVSGRLRHHEVDGRRAIFGMACLVGAQIGENVGLPIVLEERGERLTEAACVREEVEAASPAVDPCIRHGHGIERQVFGADESGAAIGDTILGVQEAIAPLVPRRRVVGYRKIADVAAGLRDLCHAPLLQVADPARRAAL